MTLSRTCIRFSWSFSAATAALFLAGCSFQNFDYLKGEYKSSGGAGGSSGSSSLPSGGGGSGGSTVAASGSTSVSGTGGTSGATGGSGGDSTGQAGEAGAPAVVPGVLLNPDFELGSGTDVQSWMSTGDVDAATIVHQQVEHGFSRLGHWLMAGAYKVSTSQVVQPLPDGNYTFKIWVQHSLVLNEEYIFARGYSHAQPAAQMKLDTTGANDLSYTQIVISNIPVTSGKCEVGIYTDGGMDSMANWSLIDNAEFTLEPPAPSAAAY